MSRIGRWTTELGRSLVIVPASIFGLLVLSVADDFGWAVIAFLGMFMVLGAIESLKDGGA